MRADALAGAVSTSLPGSLTHKLLLPMPSAAARVQQMVPQMTGLYKDEGLNYSLGGKTGNTLNSHRLLTRAYQEGGAKMQDALAERLMKGYFTEVGAAV